MSIIKDLRFALDEKGLKVFAPTLLGKTISYWDNDRQLKHGVVKAADLSRDRYGNPYIEVELDELTRGSDNGTVVPKTGAVEAAFPGGEQKALAGATGSPDTENADIN